MPKQVTIRISPQDFAQEKVFKRQLAQSLKLRPEQINAYQLLRQRSGALRSGGFRSTKLSTHHKS